MIVYIIYAFFIIESIVEARLEVPIIAMKDYTLTDYAALNRDEHRWSAMYYAIMVIGMIGISALVCGITWYLAWMSGMLLIIRRVFFEFSLKIFRDRKLYIIEGDQYWDKLIRGILGKNGGYIELAIYIPVLVFSCIYLMKHVKLKTITTIVP